MDKDGQAKHKKHFSLSNIYQKNFVEKSGKKLSNSASFPVYGQKFMRENSKTKRGMFIKYKMFGLLYWGFFMRLRGLKVLRLLVL